jgi:hypothetical protein
MDQPGGKMIIRSALRIVMCAALQLLPILIKPAVPISPTESSTIYLPIVYGVPCQPPAIPLSNGDFEMGKVAWTESDPSIIMNYAGYTGNWMASMSEYRITQSITQTLSVPNCLYNLSLWYKTVNNGFGRDHYFAINVNGVMVANLPAYDNNRWCNRTFDLSAYAGQTVELTLEKYVGDYGGWSLFYLDDISFVKDPYNNCVPW